MATLTESKDVTELLLCTQALVVTPDSTDFSFSSLGRRSKHAQCTSTRQHMMAVLAVCCNLGSEPRGGGRGGQKKRLLAVVTIYHGHVMGGLTYEHSPEFQIRPSHAV